MSGSKKVDKKAEQAADRIFAALKEVLDGMLECYDCDDEKRVIEFQVEGEPFPLHFKVTELVEGGVLNCYSTLAFDVPEEHRAAYAAAVCQLNYDEMRVGNYDFDCQTGKTLFRLSLMYRDSLIANATIEQALMTVHDTVRGNNEWLFKAARGEINVFE